MEREASIGIFDSGLGGLTVVRAVAEALPNENLVYLGDTARVPYGTRSPATIIRYAEACAKRLVQHNIKVLVVACNTVSAVAIDALRVELDIPVMGVIVPGARAGVAACRSGKLGVIATAGTVASGAYTRAVAAEGTRTEVVALAAPLLVPLVEEGWLEGEVPRLAVRKYLTPLVAADISALVLGCTHFPLLRRTIEAELLDLSGKALPVVDSAEASARELAAELDARSLNHPQSKKGSLEILVTDLPRQFSENASRFLGRDVGGLNVSAIDL